MQWPIMAMQESDNVPSYVVGLLWLKFSTLASMGKPGLSLMN